MSAAQSTQPPPPPPPSSLPLRQESKHERNLKMFYQNLSNLHSHPNVVQQSQQPPPPPPPPPLRQQSYDQSPNLSASQIFDRTGQPFSQHPQRTEERWQPRKQSEISHSKTPRQSTSPFYPRDHHQLKEDFHQPTRHSSFPEQQHPHIRGYSQQHNTANKFLNDRSDHQNGSRSPMKARDDRDGRGGGAQRRNNFHDQSRPLSPSPMRAQYQPQQQQQSNSGNSKYENEAKLHRFVIETVDQRLAGISSELEAIIISFFAKHQLQPATAAAATTNATATAYAIPPIQPNSTSTDYTPTEKYPVTRKRKTVYDAGADSSDFPPPPPTQQIPQKRSKMHQKRNQPSPMSKSHSRPSKTEKEETAQIISL